jgi:hypothetical protein
MSLDLYELDCREPVAHLDDDGRMVAHAGRNVEQLPRILFADIPTRMIHLSCGISLGEMAYANAGTGPARP